MNKKDFIIQRIIVILIAFLTGFVIIFMTSDSPFESIRSFMTMPFSNTYFFGNLLATMIPLILTGLAASIAFKTNEFNLGIEGQFYWGALAGTATLLLLKDIPVFLAVPVAMIVSSAASGIMASISAVLKSRWNVSELISSLLIGYSLVYITDFFLEGPMLDVDSGLITSHEIPSRMMFAKILSPSNLSIGIFIAMAMVIILHVLLEKGIFGLKLSFYGENPRFAKYIGINGKHIVFTSMFLSGALAGLGGIVEILGTQGKLIRGFSSGYGWNGIAIALIARNHPIWVIPAAFLFAFLDSAAFASSIFTDITPEISKVIQAAVFFLVTASLWRSATKKQVA